MLFCLAQLRHLPVLFGLEFVDLVREEPVHARLCPQRVKVARVDAPFAVVAGGSASQR